MYDSGTTAFMLVSTMLVLLNGSLRLSGLTYLTNDNIFRYLRHPAGILFVLCAVAAVSFNLLVELSALAFYFYAKQQGRLLTAPVWHTVRSLPSRRSIVTKREGRSRSSFRARSTESVTYSGSE